jgi:hypothetical protein
MFQTVLTRNVTGNNGPQLFTGLDNPDLLITVSGPQTFSSGSSLERFVNSGNTFNVRWVQNGIKGRLIPMGYESVEILFDIPSPMESFDLELIPFRLHFDYDVEIGKRIFNPEFNSLAEKLGISLDTLRYFPEHTLLLLQGIDLMASSDTRALRLQAIADRAAIAQAQADALLAQTNLASTQSELDALETSVNTIDGKVSATEAELVSISQEMIVDEEFSVASSAFVLENGFYVADVTHTLSGSRPDMTLTDSQGDDQGQAQLIIKSPTVVRIELDPEQYADNSYPLFLTLQGKKSGSSVAPGVVLMAGTNFEYRLVNGTVEYRDNSDAANVWIPVSGTGLVSQAYLFNGNLHTLSGSDVDAPGVIFYAPAGFGTGIGSNSGNWTEAAATGLALH